MAGAGVQELQQRHQRLDRCVHVTDRVLETQKPIAIQTQSIK